MRPAHRWGGVEAERSPRILIPYWRTCSALPHTLGCRYATPSLEEGWLEEASIKCSGPHPRLFSSPHRACRLLAVGGGLLLQTLL